ncbi:MAG: lipopolysaccharide assembly protein LapA domain-containing protein [Georgfuchsia sp.]
MQLTIIAAIFVALIGGIFATQNNVPVTVTFLLWRFDTSLAMVLPLALASGAIIVALLTTPATVKRQWFLARQKRQIVELEKTSESLRSRIAELEARIPAGEAAEPPPYVGLKQLILGRGSSDSATSPANAQQGRTESE